MDVPSPDSSATPPADGAAHQPTLTHAQMQISEIVRLCQEAKGIGVTDFQRPLVWKPADAVKLIYSLANKLSISQFILWRPPAGKVAQARLGSGIKEGSAELYLLDGQQRATTMTALFGTEVPSWAAYEDNLEMFMAVRNEVVINLLNGQVSHMKPEAREGLPQFWTYNRLCQEVLRGQDGTAAIMAALIELGEGPGEAAMKAMALHGQVSAVLHGSVNVDTGTWSPDQAVEQFTLTNTAGRDLSDEEVLFGFLAMHSLGLRARFDQAIQKLIAAGAKGETRAMKDKLANSLLRTVLGYHATRVGLGVQARIESYAVHKRTLVTKDITASVGRVEEAWLQVISLLKQAGHAPDRISSLNAVVSLVLAVERWPELRAKGDDRVLALYAMANRYSRHQKHSTDAHAKDAQALNAARSADEWFQAMAGVYREFLERVHGEVLPTSPEEILALNKSAVARKTSPRGAEYIILGVRQGWIDPMTGATIDFAAPSNAYQWHHVFPENLAAKQCAGTAGGPPSWVDSLANLMVVERATNNNYDDQVPQIALAHTKGNALAAQFFTRAPEMTGLEVAETIVAERAVELAYQLDWPLRLLGLL